MIDLFEAALPPWASALSETVHLQTKLLPLAIRGHSQAMIDDSKETDEEEEEITYAYLALRVFILDRSIRYEELRGIDKHLYGQEKALRPRIHYSPKCYQMSSCVRTLGHEGRCVPSTECISRLVELKETTPPPWVLGSSLPGSGTIISSSQNQTNMSYAHRMLASSIANTSRPSTYNGSGLSSQTSNGQTYSRTLGRYVPSVPSQPTYVYEMTKRDPELFDLEAMQPYVPLPADILQSEWV